jgi:endonuclease YncB( thermonuclease family)
MFRFCLLFLLLGCTNASLADVSGTVRVIDGDTFDVGTVRVRLHGIDAPEQAQTCQTPRGADWACGAWVTRQVAELYGGKLAYCLQQDVDRYGRIVATCQIAGRDVGRALVSGGLAFAYTRYSEAYVLDEKRAAVNRFGLHASDVQAPSEYRAAVRAERVQNTQGRFAPNASCAIKGNISKSGRIYHRPGQRDYARTGITASKGERWFCSEAEALAAGWRAAQR